MNLFRSFAAALMVALPFAIVSAQPHDSVYVVIRTELGDIRVALFADAAPVTVENFLDYVRSGHYDGGSFFRTVRTDNQPHDRVKIAVIQAGGHPWEENFTNEPIMLERTSETGLRHVDGTISMARTGPDTATTSFFICVGNQPALDYGGQRNPDGQGFAAFGIVVDGMDIVHQIHEMKARGQSIMPPVRILEVVADS